MEDSNLLSGRESDDALVTDTAYWIFDQERIVDWFLTSHTKVIIRVYVTMWYLISVRRLAVGNAIDKLRIPLLKRQVSVVNL